MYFDSTYACIIRLQNQLVWQIINIWEPMVYIINLIFEKQVSIYIKTETSYFSKNFYNFNYFKLLKHFAVMMVSLFI